MSGARLTHLTDARQRFAHWRHELRTPVNAITNYSEMLLEDVADWPDADKLRRDLREIGRAGQEFLALVNQLLTPNEAEWSAEGWQQLGARLRHDLMTPVSVMLGYSQLLLEEQGQTALLPDLQRIHTAANQCRALIQQGVGSREDSAATTPLPALAEATAPRAFSPAEYGPVLVVDDLEMNRDLLARRLQREGLCVQVAGGGREALAMLRATSFDLVLLDVMMPEMNGYQVLQQLKADAAWREIPVIMISALDELDSVVRCLEAGAEDYLPKPFEPVILRARVNACLEKKRLRNQEIEYLQNVARISAAAAAVEAENYQPESLAAVALRADELGRLARVFQQMAREVYAREQRLKQQVQQLRIEIDEVKKAQQVAEITETDYFQQLQQKAQALRRKP